MSIYSLARGLYLLTRTTNHIFCVIILPCIYTIVNLIIYIYREIKTKEEESIGDRGTPINVQSIGTRSSL